MKKAILHSKKPISRNDGSKAYPLNESDLPFGDGSPESLLAIAEYLDVERSLRYKRKQIDGKVVSTYCNIYAYDFCYLAGAYIPRIWWYPKAIQDIEKGMDLQAKYGDNVSEMNANGLFNWFETWGNHFGWVKQNDLVEAQELANKGWCVVIIAKNNIITRSGHITMIVPEHQGFKARKVNKNFLPLQSQAGIVNKKYFNDNWFVSSKFSGWNVYAYQLK